MSDNLSPPGLFERMHRAYRVHGVALWAEKLYPSALGTIAGLLAGTRTLTVAQVDALVTDVLPVAISVTAILAGFQATAQAMMLAIIRSEVVEFLKRTKHYDFVVGYLWAAFFWLLLFVVTAVVVLAVNAAGVDLYAWRHWLAGVLAFLLTIALACSFRISNFMIRVLRVKN